MVSQVESTSQLTLAPAPMVVEAMTPSVADNDQPMPNMPVAKPLGDLVAYMNADPSELLRCRYLCRGGGMLLVGPTGIGKSSFAMQCMISWALGRDVFSINPNGALKSLLIQAENDEGDMGEMRDGVIQGMGLGPEEQTAAKTNVRVCSESARTGGMFISQVVAPLLERYKPDLLWIDPALAYLGGESNAQRDVTTFLRNESSRGG